MLEKRMLRRESYRDEKNYKMKSIIIYYMGPLNYGG
jgi:hypothetical protein